MNRNAFRELQAQQAQSTKFWAGVAVVLLVLVGLYFWNNLSQYLAMREAVARADSEISALNEELAVKRLDYQKEKVAAEAFYREVDSKLAAILPSANDYTSLTRQIDGFEKELAKRHNPFEISNISYQDAVETEKGAVLPLRMNIRSSANNFEKFLHLIENSGSLDSSLRLMEISSIRLNFLEGSEEEGEIINFSVQINAYFQK